MSLSLDTPLASLEHADLIRRVLDASARTAPGEAYQFKHTLIQESVYGALLRNERRALHRATAQALERIYPSDLDENAAVLARHFAEAGDDAKTFEYSRRAADAAWRVQALAEALMQYETAVRLAAELPLSAQDLLHVHIQRGRVLEVMGRYDEAIAAYRALYALGQTRDDAVLETHALLSLATLFTFPNKMQDLDQALRVNQQALALAQAAHDGEAEARALWNMQQHAFFTGQAKESYAYGQQALALAERLGLDDLRAHILNDLSRSLVSVVSVTSALDALAQARSIWRSNSNLSMLVDNLSTSAETALTGGEMEKAEQFALESQELSRTIGNLWNQAYSFGQLLQIYALRGETGRIYDQTTEMNRLARAAGFFIAIEYGDIFRASVFGDLGAPQRGIDVLTAYDSGEPIMLVEGWRLATIAYLNVLQGNLSAARVALERAQPFVIQDDLTTYGPIYVALCNADLAQLEERYADMLTISRALAARLRALGIRYYLPIFLLREGRAHYGLKEWDAAQAILQEGEQLARSMQARFALWEILALLGDLERQRGTVERARAYWTEAREIIEWLADHAPAEFRESFLARPEIRAVLDARE